MKLQFIDSYKFLASSLDKLASLFDKDKLQILQREFCNLSAENFNLLTRKGIFPYVHWLRRKVGGHVFTAARIVL